jgi:hypothetical protein
MESRAPEQVQLAIANCVAGLSIHRGSLQVLIQSFDYASDWQLERPAPISLYSVG